MYLFILEIGFAKDTPTSTKPSQDHTPVFADSQMSISSPNKALPEVPLTKGKLIIFNSLALTYDTYLYQNQSDLTHTLNLIYSHHHVS